MKKTLALILIFLAATAQAGCDLGRCTDFDNVKECGEKYQNHNLDRDQWFSCAQTCSESNCQNTRNLVDTIIEFLTGVPTLGVDPWSYDQNSDCYISSSEANTAVNDWSQDKISLSDSINVISLFEDQTRNPACGTPTQPATVDCYQNSDCGSQYYESDAHCSNDQILSLGYNIVPFCNNPGTTQAYCVIQHISTNKQDCSYLCSEGACIPAPTTTTTTQPVFTCVDSDGGLDYGIKGTISFSNGGYHIDECQNNQVVEYYCLASTAASTSKGYLWDIKKADCPGGNCIDGHCAPGTTTSSSTTTTQPQPNGGASVWVYGVVLVAGVGLIYYLETRGKHQKK